MKEPYIINDPLIRAKNPKAGDVWQDAGKRMTLTGVCDSKIYAVVMPVPGARFLTGPKQISLQFSLEEFPDLAKRTLEAGASFIPYEKA